jgi:hypothetical protein
MKIIVLFLFSFSLAFCYVVDNSSIKVGISRNTGTWGSSAEFNGLQNTLQALGFSYYQSTVGNGQDYSDHGCQVVYNDSYTIHVTGWDWRMSLEGRGFIQNGFGSAECWPYFSCWIITAMDVPTSTVHITRNLSPAYELMLFPNVMPQQWLADGIHWGYNPCYHTLMAYGNGDEIDHNWYVEAQHPLVLGGTTKNALIDTNIGKGRIVMCGWQVQGPNATTIDKNLFENLIIYAAQPPKAEAGGPYCAPVGVPVTLNASQSTDDQQIVLYQWDINNDGEYEISTPNPTAQWTWNQPYNDTIELRVKDNLNCRSYDWAYGQIGFVDVNPDTLGTIKSLYH